MSGSDRGVTFCAPLLEGLPVFLVFLFLEEPVEGGDDRRGWVGEWVVGWLGLGGWHIGDWEVVGGYFTSV